MEAIVTDARLEFFGLWFVLMLMLAAPFLLM
jgi:hypothetical protein